MKAIDNYTQNAKLNEQYCSKSNSYLIQKQIKK